VIIVAAIGSRPADCMHPASASDVVVITDESSVEG
jgi:hypothetical protein